MSTKVVELKTVKVGKYIVLEPLHLLVNMELQKQD